MNRFFSSTPVWQVAGLTLVRVAIGCFLVYHGSEIFDPAKVGEYLEWEVFKNSSGKLLVYGGKTAELVAGVFFVFGLFTRVASLLLIATMLYITFFLGHGKIWYEDQYPFLFVLLGLVFLIMGGGKLSLDHLIFNKRNKYA